MVWEYVQQGRRPLLLWSRRQLDEESCGRDERGLRSDVACVRCIMEFGAHCKWSLGNDRMPNTSLLDEQARLGSTKPEVKFLASDFHGSTLHMTQLSQLHISWINRMQAL